MYRLENWAVVYPEEANPYYPPETIPRYLNGQVYGHPKYKDGDRIFTSHIVESVGRIVTTKSGSKYELGKVLPDYENYVKESGRVIDEDNPVKILIPKN